MSVVLDMWWEGSDFHIVTDDNRHTVYKNAHVTDIHRDFTDAPNVIIKTRDLTFVRRDPATLPSSSE